MTNDAWGFATQNPGTTLLMAFLAVTVVSGTVHRLFTLANRWIRHRNILAHGWPPPYLDADGDVVDREGDR